MGESGIKRLPLRVRLTETLVRYAERHLEGRGQSLQKPAEIHDAIIIGLILRREATGHKVWHYAYILSGARGRIKIGNWPAVTVDAARKAATLLAAQVVQGIDPAVEKRRRRQANASPRDGQTLGAFVDGPYARWATAHLKSHREALAALRADFGDRKKAGRKKGAGWWTRKINSLTAWDADVWQTTELVRGNKPTTINRAWQRLHAALAKAVEWKLLSGPLPRLKKLKVNKRGRVRFLSSAERRRLFAALDEREQKRRDQRARLNAWRAARHRRPLADYGSKLYTDYLQPLTRVYLGTGMRLSEGTSMIRGNVDLEAGYITIPEDVAKSRQARVIPMTADVKATLLRWLAQQGSMLPIDLVFSYRGNRIRNIRKAWIGLMKLAQIANYRVHDNRHDFASRLAMGGVDLKTIAELLGHEDLEQVQRYAHLSPQHVREAVRTLDSQADLAALDAATASSRSVQGIEEALTKEDRALAPSVRLN